MSLRARYTQRVAPFELDLYVELHLGERGIHSNNDIVRFLEKNDFRTEARINGLLMRNPRFSNIFLLTQVDLNEAMDKHVPAIIASGFVPQTSLQYHAGMDFVPTTLQYVDILKQFVEEDMPFSLLFRNKKDLNAPASWVLGYDPNTQLICGSTSYATLVDLVCPEHVEANQYDDKSKRQPYFFAFA